MGFPDLTSGALRERESRTVLPRMDLRHGQSGFHSLTHMINTKYVIREPRKLIHLTFHTLIELAMGFSSSDKLMPLKTPVSRTAVILDPPFLQTLTVDYI